MPKKSVVPKIATDPLAELERKVEALTVRVDQELCQRPVGEQTFVTKPALLGSDPAAHLVEQWKSVRDRAARGWSGARVYLARVVITPWAGAGLLALALALMHMSLPYLLVALALVGAAITTSSPTASPIEKSPLA